MKRMSDVFELPVINAGRRLIERSSNECAYFNLPNESKAAAHAINHVDALEDSLESMINLVASLSFKLKIDRFEQPRYKQSLEALKSYRGEK